MSAGHCNGLAQDSLEVSQFDELRLRFRDAWHADTSFAPADWSPDNPAFGQCAVTALIVQDLFGGELLRACIAGGSHYWNLLPEW